MTRAKCYVSIGMKRRFMMVKMTYVFYIGWKPVLCNFCCAIRWVCRAICNLPGQATADQTRQRQARADLEGFGRNPIDGSFAVIATMIMAMMIVMMAKIDDGGDDGGGNDGGAADDGGGDDDDDGVDR